MPFLLTWLVHGLALAAIVRGILRVAGKTSAATRYAVCWAALAIVLALPLALLTPGLASSIRLFGATGADAADVGDAAPALRAHAAPMQPASATQSASLTQTVSTASHVASPLVRLPGVPDWLAALAIGLWLGVVSLGLLRIVLGIDAILRLKASSRPFPAARARKLAGWRAVRRQGRLVELRVSDDVASASFLGLTRPVIAISPALAASLTDEELDLTVMHEFAHVQRWDDWTKLAQLLLMAVCGWHPGVRLLDRAIDLERESACDDWVVRRTGSARGYARCLVKIVQTMPRATASLVPAAYNEETCMETRVKRLLDATRPRHAWAPFSVTATACAAAVVALLLTQLAPIGALVGHAAGVDQASARADTMSTAATVTGVRATRGSRGSDVALPVESVVADSRDAESLDNAPFPARSSAGTTAHTLQPRALQPRALQPRSMQVASLLFTNISTRGDAAPQEPTGSQVSAAPAAPIVPGLEGLSQRTAETTLARTSAADPNIAAAYAGSAGSGGTPAPANVSPTADTSANTAADADEIPGGADAATGDLTPERLRQAARSTTDALGAGMRKSGSVAGDGLRTAGTAAGEGLKQAGLATGDGLAHAGVATGHAAGTAASKTGSGLKKSGVSTGRALAKVGNAFKIF